MKSNAFNLIESLNINEILDLQCLFHDESVTAYSAVLLKIMQHYHT